ncbi:MAG TPA: cell division protein FtsL [Candidatus Manganitrophaceae bacterium]|nr:cell division protein FtsL [Candidatus Manganitrophaceae bacterium]
MREPSNRSAKHVSRLIFLTLGGSILTLAFLSLWQRNQMIYIGYEIEQLREEKEALLRVQKELRVEAESLGAMERIERIAVEQLAMKPNVSKQRIYVNAEGLLPASEGGSLIEKAGARRFSSFLPAPAFADKKILSD